MAVSEEITPFGVVGKLMMKVEGSYKTKNGIILGVILSQSCSLGDWRLFGCEYDRLVNLA